MAKIMLVEDDNNLREIYGARLLAEGYEIVAAKDGEEALATAVKEKPDLIISDVMMPRISGFDMLDILRNAPETKFTKVIMMTALSQAEDKARADALGADRYLVKSQVTLEDVARVVKDVLEGKSENDAADAVVETTGANTTQAQTAGVNAEAEPTGPAPEPVSIETPAVPEPTPVTEPIAVAVPETLPEPSIPAAVSTTDPAATATPTADDTLATTPAPEPVVIAADPVVATADPSPVTDTAVASPASDPVVAPPITVQLPTDAQPETPAAEPAPAAETEVASDLPDLASVGPNLMEALQQENDANPNSEPENQPTEAVVTTPEPAIVNGTPVSPVIEPTTSAAPEPVVIDTPAPVVEAPAETPAPEPAPATEAGAPAAEPATNPLDDTRKKVIIQPINDITKGPDLDKLVAAEEAKAGVQTPAASSVVTPTETPADAPTAAPAGPATEHDVIAL